LYLHQVESTNWEGGGKRSPKNSDWSTSTMQPFFDIFSNWNFKVSKNSKKIYVDVVKYIHYGHAKF
jgi:hypothetical protein